METSEIQEMGFGEGDIKLQGTIGMVGLIDDDFILKNCNSNSGTFLSLGTNLRSVFTHQYEVYDEYSTPDDPSVTEKA